MSVPLPDHKGVLHNVFFSSPSLVLNVEGVGVCADLPAGSLWHLLTGTIRRQCGYFSLAI